MNSKILIFGLDYSLTKSIAKKISDRLDMYFLDIKDLISYNLQDESHIKQTAGVDYYNNQLYKLATGVSFYENTLVNFEYDLLLDEKIYKELKNNFTIVFFNFSYDLLNSRNNKDEFENLNTTLMVYDEVTALCKNISNYVIDASLNIEENVDKFLSIVYKK